MKLEEMIGEKVMQPITIPCGQILGTKGKVSGVIAYKGIRYATAGRFEYPVEVTSWEGVYEATEYGNCCYQPRSFYDEEKVPEKAFYYNEFRKGETYTYSEDCLFLNIWVPENATKDSKLPVLFYIHGGGFTGGCGHEKHFDGPIWPKKGVIAVTINYRLGPLGFLCLPELAGRDGHTGNYGLYDQMTAMQWVQHNIEAFGGDPSQVTIMGQSAGAMSVQQHCISPLTDGLFSKAVLSSGGGVSPMFNTKNTYEDLYEFGQQVEKEAGCNTLEEFLSLEPEKLFAAWQIVKKSERKYAMAAAPCLDGRLLVKGAMDVAKAGEQKNIPYLLGSTSQDVAPPFIFSMARKWCLRQDKQHKQPSFCWFFDRKLPGDGNGAWHSSDLWYWFGTLKNGWRPFEQKDYELSDAMSSYLCQFVKTGNPNQEGLPTWQPITESQKHVLRIGEGKIRMGSVNMAKLFITMLTNKAVGE